MDIFLEMLFCLGGVLFLLISTMVIIHNAIIDLKSWYKRKNRLWQLKQINEIRL